MPRLLGRTDWKGLPLGLDTKRHVSAQRVAGYSSSARLLATTNAYRLQGYPLRAPTMDGST
eukprot:2836654-Amphidinium_carterae.1